MSDRPAYGRVFWMFARNSLVRDMTFRANFLIEGFTSLSWMLMSVGFYLLVFKHAPSIGGGAEGWNEHQFFIFMATTMIINALVQAFFMPNMEEFSELIRSGGLDLALLKPIDTQFLISLRKVEWSPLANVALALVLIVYSLAHLPGHPRWEHFALYPLYVACGVGIFYSLMIIMASFSVWLGRNQSLYEFWFYVTNFSRYPLEIYRGRYGTPLQYFFTYAIPVLVVVNVPARLLAKPLDASQWKLAGFALLATAASLLVSRLLFQRALASYRSASS